MNRKSIKNEVNNETNKWKWRKDCSYRQTRSYAISIFFEFANLFNRFVSCANVCNGIYSFSIHIDRLIKDGTAVANNQKRNAFTSCQ